MYTLIQILFLSKIYDMPVDNRKIVSFQCIYEHENVADIDKARRIYNSAFWVDISERPDLVKRNKDYAKSSLNMTDRRKEFGRGKEDELLEESCDPLLFKH